MTWESMGYDAFGCPLPYPWPSGQGFGKGKGKPQHPGMGGQGPYGMGRPGPAQKPPGIFGQAAAATAKAKVEKDRLKNQELQRLRAEVKKLSQDGQLAKPPENKAGVVQPGAPAAVAQAQDNTVVLCRNHKGEEVPLVWQCSCKQQHWTNKKQCANASCNKTRDVAEWTMVTSRLPGVRAVGPCAQPTAQSFLGRLPGWQNLLVDEEAMLVGEEEAAAAPDLPAPVCVLDKQLPVDPAVEAKRKAAEQWLTVCKAAPTECLPQGALEAAQQAVDALPLPCVVSVSNLETLSGLLRRQLEAKEKDTTAANLKLGRLQTSLATLRKQVEEQQAYCFQVESSHDHYVEQLQRQIVLLTERCNESKDAAGLGAQSNQGALGGLASGLPAAVTAMSPEQAVLWQEFVNFAQTEEGFVLLGKYQGIASLTLDSLAPGAPASRAAANPLLPKGGLGKGKGLSPCGYEPYPDTGKVKQAREDWEARQELFG